MAFKKAVKEQVKLRLGLCGLAGSGKTYSALAIATHLVPGGRIALIDTERGSAKLYADKFTFDVDDELDAFSPLAYVEKIKAAEQAGYDIIIIDSLSHAWAGKGGALEQKDAAAERSGNSWTAWRNVTPKHNQLVDAMLTSTAHVIATMRQKMEHVQETNNGKVEIRKVGLAAIQREGMEYEFTCVGDVDHSHTLKITKTRCGGVIDVGDMFEKPGELFATKIRNWMLDGAPPAPRSVPSGPNSETAAYVEKMAQPDTLAPELDKVFASYLAAMEAAQDVATLERVATGPAKPAKGTPEHARAAATFLACKSKLMNGVAA